jgi:hypothetical protein
MMDRDEQLDVSLHAKAPACPQVIVTFSDYEPPFDVALTTQRLLDSVPRQYLTELDAVMLTNASGLPQKRRNSTVKARQRKVRLSATRGLYHPAANGNRAWIEIFVDNTLRGWEKGWWLRVPFIRESKLSDVLFHEIGHHIHFAIRPEYRDKEDVADVWKVRLERNYHQQRFSWMRIVSRLVRPLFGHYLERQRRKLELEMFKSGQISQAEYLESVAKRQSGHTTTERR